MKLNISWSEKFRRCYQVIHNSNSPFLPKRSEIQQKESGCCHRVHGGVCVTWYHTHQPHCPLTHTCSLQQNELSGMIWGGSYTWQKQKNMLLNALAEQPEPFGGVSEKLTTYNIATKCTRALVWASIMVLSSAVIKSNPIMLGLHAIFAIYVMKISMSVCGCETLNTSGTQKQRKKASAFGYISGENSKLHCYHGRNLLDNFYYCRLLIAFTKTFTSCEKRCVVPDQATS